MIDLAAIPNVMAAIKSAWPVADTSLQQLARHLTPVTFPRRGVMITAGIFNGLAYFVEKGMTRSYWLVDGEEVTTSFSHEGSLVFSMDEVYYGLRSMEYVEAVSRVNAYSIHISLLRDMIRGNLDLSNWWGIIHQNEYRRIHRSHMERLTLPARERYEQFASQFPDVCRRARLGDIASYLGLASSTLSRIRAGKD